MYSCKLSISNYCEKMFLRTAGDKCLKSFLYDNEMFVSCSFTHYLLLILHSVSHTQTIAAFETCRPVPGSKLLTELKSSMACCLSRQTADPCCFLFVFPHWLQLCFPSDVLSCLQGKTSNIMFSLWGPKCP